jgi:hypothetical protein
MGSLLRKPLGVFVAALAVGLAVILVGMKAYGGNSGGAVPPPTPQLSPVVMKAKFQHAAIQMCLSSRALIKGIIARGKPRSLRDATSDFHWMTPRIDSLARQIDGLVPPPSDARTAAALKRVRSKLNRFDRALDHLDHFAETGQWRMFVLLARSPGFKRLSKQFGSSRKVRNIHCGQASLNNIA